MIGKEKVGLQKASKVPAKTGRTIGKAPGKPKERKTLNSREASMAWGERGESVRLY